MAHYNGRVQDAVFDRLVDGVAASIGARGSRDPVALRLLIHDCAQNGRASHREVLAGALGDVVDARLTDDATADPGWALLFADAAALADDERIGTALAAEVRRLRQQWPARGPVAAAMHAVGACLHAWRQSPWDLSPSLTAAAAVDELERCAGTAYRPGEGVAHRLDRPDGPLGTLDDHLASADALLAAYALTARLPYPMLAEEIVAAARRQWWTADRRFGEGDRGPGAAGDFAVNCEAAQVLARLAALDADPDYRAQVAAADHMDYRADARGVLEWLAAECPDGDERRAAALGMALAEWHALAR